MRAVSLVIMLSIIHASNNEHEHSASVNIDQEMDAGRIGDQHPSDANRNVIFKILGENDASVHDSFEASQIVSQEESVCSNDPISSNEKLGISKQIIKVEAKIIKEDLNVIVGDDLTTGQIISTKKSASDISPDDIHAQNVKNTFSSLKIESITASDSKPVSKTQEKTSTTANHNVTERFNYAVFII